MFSWSGCSSTSGSRRKCSHGQDALVLQGSAESVLMVRMLKYLRVAQKVFSWPGCSSTSGLRRKCSHGQDALLEEFQKHRLLQVTEHVSGTVTMALMP